jgi:hypothetical protein
VTEATKSPLIPAAEARAHAQAVQEYEPQAVISNIATYVEAAKNQGHQSTLFPVAGHMFTGDQDDESTWPAWLATVAKALRDAGYAASVTHGGGAIAISWADQPA